MAAVSIQPAMTGCLPDTKVSTDTIVQCTRFTTSRMVRLQEVLR